jgi:hypothetical protein
MRRSFQHSLNELAFDPVVRRLAAGSSWGQIQTLAHEIAASDPFGEARFIARALAHVSDGRNCDPLPFIEHQLWCAWREARWQCKTLRSGEVRLEVVNGHWLAETQGHPTLFLTPMTLALSDAVLAIQRLVGGRPVILYGEGIDAIESGNPVPRDWIAGEGRSAVRRIRRTLDTKGVFCTYPDFVYEGHAACQTRLFNLPRPMSSGFVSIAAQTDTMLLPCVLLRQGDALVAHFEEPTHVVFEDAELSKSSRLAAMEEIAPAIAGHLESLIRLAPHQWLLLPTLTFDSPQMAAARG